MEVRLFLAKSKEAENGEKEEVFYYASFDM
jgi:hypothetical protein